MKAWFLFIGITLMANMSTAHASSINTPIMVENISTTNIFSIAQNTTSIFSITQNAITDNVWFKEMSYDLVSNQKVDSNWLAHSLWWMNPSKTITIDLGSSFAIQDVLIQIDSNDQYQLDYSIDNVNWSNLFTVSPEDGEFSYGMDTMSSDPLHNEYIASIDFSIIEAQYIRMSASGGDNFYLLSELQVFGTPNNNPSTFMQARTLSATTVSAVPAPPSLMLFSLGLMVLAGLQYRRKKLTSNA